MISTLTLKTENAVLGLCLNGEMDRALNAGLSIDHFFNLNNKMIFSEIKKIYYKNIPVKLDNLSVYLSQEQTIEAIDINQNAPIGTNIGGYIDELKKALWVVKIANCTRNITTAMSNWKPNEPIDPIKIAVDSFNLCNIEIKQESNVTDEGAVEEYLEKVIMDSESGGVKAISTKIKKIDGSLNGGFLPGKLITFAARPGMGKTALLTNMAAAAASQGHTVQYVSIELLRDEVMDRLVCINSGLDTRVVASRKYNESNSDQFMTGTGDLKKVKVIFEVYSKGKWESVEDVIRAQNRIRKTRIVFIDYIQQFHIASKKFQSRSSELSEITARAKGLAHELGITIVIAAQLNRGIETDTPRMPRLSDLKDSGAIEQDSDYVGMLYDAKEDYHLGIVVLKNRCGPIGYFKVRADLSINKFYEE